MCICLCYEVKVEAKVSDFTVLGVNAVLKLPNARDTGENHLHA